jgi:DNA repair protein RadC
MIFVNHLLIGTSVLNNNAQEANKRITLISKTKRTTSGTWTSKSYNSRTRYPIEVLADTSVNELKKIFGMGEVKAGKIVAAFELGKRSLGNGRKTSIRSVEDVVREVNDIRDQNKEHLIALYLNARNELIMKQTIAIGTLNQNIIQPRDVFADALKNPCAAVVLIHNHPSGDPEPSDQDIIFTKKLIEAGKLLGIEILDHIVVARDGDASLKASNLI